MSVMALIFVYMIQLLIESCSHINTYKYFSENYKINIVRF